MTTPENAICLACRPACLPLPPCLAALQGRPASRQAGKPARPFGPFILSPSELHAACCIAAYTFIQLKHNPQTPKLNKKQLLDVKFSGIDRPRCSLIITYFVNVLIFLTIYIYIYIWKRSSRWRQRCTIIFFSCDIMYLQFCCFSHIWDQMPVHLKLGCSFH